jgi:ribose 5-phosphate isomerase B
MKIAVASDHAGYELKEVLKKYLEEEGHDVDDCGAHSAERSDYPDFGRKGALAVKEGRAQRAVLVCGSGIGMCMTANRFEGVRAAVLRDAYDAEMSRKHNDANVACFGERVSDPDAARGLLEVFLNTDFEGGRHEARVKKIDNAGG